MMEVMPIAVTSSAPSVIRHFHQDPWRALSNMHPASVMQDGIPCPTVEHAYVLAKLDPSHPERDRHVTAILAEPDPRRVKQMGRSIPLRDRWDDMKKGIMLALLWQKYDHRMNPACYDVLMKTGHAVIEEGNWWGDRYFGIAYRDRVACENGHGGVGQNVLGILLMDIRAECEGSCA
jgi:ribA/ribD-fused uncharacterized protein